VLGAVTSVATIGATAAQFAMARVDLNRAYRRLSIFSVFSSAFAAAPYFMTPLPGNLLYRGQIYFANAYLTSATVALFVYARQIIGVGYQGYNFFLRSDFREFAQWLRSARPSGLYILYNSTAIRFACAIVLAIVFVSAVLYVARPTLAILLVLYSVSIIASSTSSVLQRVFLLINRAHINVFVLTLSTVIGVIYMRFAINSRGIYSLLVCEIFAYTLQTVTLLALLYLKRMPIPQANPTY
jgi:hypothetical protein